MGLPRAALKAAELIGLASPGELPLVRIPDMGDARAAGPGPGLGGAELVSAGGFDGVGGEGVAATGEGAAAEGDKAVTAGDDVEAIATGGETMAGDISGDG